MLPTIHFLGGPPGTGKSTVAPLVVQHLQHKHDRTVVLLDGDMFYPPQARVMDSERSGIELDTPEFAKKFNLPNQLEFQRIVREVAGKKVVLCTAPFENMYCMVGEKPLWEKMQSEDFKGFSISMTYMLTLGDSVEAEIKDRLRKRGRRNPYHRRLDLPKIQLPNFYAKRADLVRKSVASFGFPLVEVEIEEEPEVTAQRIAEEILATESRH